MLLWRRLKLLLGAAGMLSIMAGSTGLLLVMESSLFLGQGPHHPGLPALEADALKDRFAKWADGVLNSLPGWHHGFFAQLLYHIMIDVLAISVFLMTAAALVRLTCRLAAPALLHRQEAHLASAETRLSDEDSASLSAAAIL